MPRHRSKCTCEIHSQIDPRVAEALSQERRLERDVCPALNDAANGPAADGAALVAPLELVCTHLAAASVAARSEARTAHLTHADDAERRASWHASFTSAAMDGIGSPSSWQRGPHSCVLKKLSTPCAPLSVPPFLCRRLPVVET